MQPPPPQQQQLKTNLVINNHNYNHQDRLFFRPFLNSVKFDYVFSLSLSFYFLCLPIIILLLKKTSKNWISKNRNVLSVRQWQICKDIFTKSKIREGRKLKYIERWILIIASSLSLFHSIFFSFFLLLSS